MGEPRRKAAFVEAGGGAHVAWLGSQVRYLAVAEQTARRYAVSIAQVTSDTLPLVRHRDQEGLYVLSGELDVGIGGRTLTVPAGGFLNVPPGAPRRLASTDGGPTDVLAIAAPAGFDEFQFRSGLPLSGPAEPVPAATEEDRSAAAALGAVYGVELDPPAAACDAQPSLRVMMPGEGSRLAVVGDVYRFLAVSEDTVGGYALWHATVPPGGGPPLHSHANEDEAFYVLGGTVTFHSDGATRRIGPGGFVHAPSGTRHRFANETDAPATMLIFIAPGGLEKMLEAVGRVWHDDASPSGPPDRREIERLAELAPKYGIELYL